MSTAAAEPRREPAALERREMLDRRRRESLTWRVIHVLGSLKLALVLLATIALACAAATFFESTFNAKIARAYIYRAPWFLGWLGVLCLNLLAATLTRWPWQRKHVGFVITHYGIITLLAGAIIGMQFGFEGNVRLHKNAPPVGRITTSRSVLQVENPTDRALYLMPFEADVPRPTADRPRVVPVPGSALRIVIDRYSDNLVKEDRLVASASPSARPGVWLRLASPMVSQQVSAPLSLTSDDTATHDFFGMARIVLLPKLPDREPKAASEAQMIFVRYQPVVQGDGPATGISVRLSADGATITVVAPDGTTATYDRAASMGKPIHAGSATVVPREYWPDFAMKDGKPVSASDEPKNPALLVQASGPAQASVSGDSERPLFELAPGGDGDRIAYQLSRGGAVYDRGEARVGELVTLGWADWKAEVKAILRRSEVRAETRDGGSTTGASGSGVPGFRARLRAAEGGTDGPAAWVESGSVTTLERNGDAVRVGYGLERRPIPFSIRLVDFEVPRYEGTETPANYISTVEFRDAATGAVRTGVAKMNHPASWPGGFRANVTGLNYKFSQAEWNPQDLGETTLQVLYDPGWLLKWVGSVAICAGIAIMFYLKPKLSNRPAGSPLP